MRIPTRILAMTMLLSVGILPPVYEASAQRVTVSFQLFYDHLAPYGYWVDYPEYGYVWIPNVASGFEPYVTEGHWIYSEYGWTWVSDYPWGWAPFHYGRWHYDSVYGWMWIPDTQWGPAWVVWRRANGYFGWCAMEPGVTIKVVLGGGWNPPVHRWVFVKEKDITSVHIQRYAVDQSRKTSVLKESRVIGNKRTDNGVEFLQGPDKDEVQKVAGHEIRKVEIRDGDKPGHDLNNDRLQLYRPQVKKQDDPARKPVPGKVTKLKDLKPSSEQDKEKKSPPAKKKKDKEGNHSGDGG